VKCHKEQDAVTKNDKELACAFIVLSRYVNIGRYWLEECERGPELDLNYPYPSLYRISGGRKGKLAGNMAAFYTKRNS
jgi:hypothetical protein